MFLFCISHRHTSIERKIFVGNATHGPWIESFTFLVAEHRKRGRAKERDLRASEKSCRFFDKLLADIHIAHGFYVLIRISSVWMRTLSWIYWQINRDKWHIIRISCSIFFRSQRRRRRRHHSHCRCSVALSLCFWCYFRSQTLKYLILCRFERGRARTSGKYACVNWCRCCCNRQKTSTHFTCSIT